ncbi:hypothetical protein C8R43DRAFT_962343 [Mycena crocata]|nr:hypothetical protein C8R43DRAFT_962343 [Mycena crocata]
MGPGLGRAWAGPKSLGLGLKPEPGTSLVTKRARARYHRPRCRIMAGGRDLWVTNNKWSKKECRSTVEVMMKTSSEKNNWLKKKKRQIGGGLFGRWESNPVSPLQLQREAGVMGQSTPEGFKLDKSVADSGHQNENVNRNLNLLVSDSFVMNL